MGADAGAVNARERRLRERCSVREAQCKCQFQGPRQSSHLNLRLCSTGRAASLRMRIGEETASGTQHAGILSVLGPSIGDPIQRTLYLSFPSRRGLTGS